VEVAKPAAYDAVVKMVNEGKFDAAIPVLEKMITDYEMLQWDNKARDLLGYAYTKQQDFKKAVATYEDLMKNALPSELTPELRRRYWDAMIGKGEYPALVKNLDELIAKGSREEAATAHLVRGDVYKAQGQTLDALFDYLRVAILYEQVKSVQPEALYKAARAMEDLRDPRAADMKKRLVQEYPRSEEAQKVQGTM
jgi:TolA-binding protein